MADKLPTKRATQVPFGQWYEALRHLTEDAQEGDGAAKEALAEMLESQPDKARHLNWDKSVRTHLLQSVTRPDDPSRHVIPARLDEIKRRLQADGSSALEGLLIERILTCWTHVFVAEMRWVTKSEQDITIQAGDYCQRTLDRSHRRYASALKALAEVRKLLGVSVGMVNVVQNQTVSIASGSPAAPDASGRQTAAERSTAPVEGRRDGGIGSVTGEGQSE